MFLRLPTGPERIAGHVLGELIPKADQLVGASHDLDRCVVGDCVGKRCRRQMVLLLCGSGVPERDILIDNIRHDHTLRDAANEPQ
jgi:hypothetical protein